MNNLIGGENREMMLDLGGAKSVVENIEPAEEITRKVYGAICRALEYFLSESSGDENRLNPGPEYIARSSGGVDLVIKSVFFDLQEPRSRYMLIAEDQSGKVVGYRSMAMLETVDSVSATGHISTLLRNMGIAMVLDSANLDVLRRISNSRAKSVQWMINDGNVTADERSVEHKRWESLYGEDGKMQVDSSGNVVIPFIEHNLGLDALDVIRTISLTRNDSKLYNPTVVSKNVDILDNRVIDANFRMTLSGLVEKLK